MTTATNTINVQQEVQQQAGKLINHFAGCVGFKTIEIGLKNGLLSALADQPEGLTAAGLASKAETDEFYTGVWARAAYAADLLEVDGEYRYRLAPHIDKLLINENFPGYVGGIPAVFSQPEFFDHFSGNLKTGSHIWWEDTSPAFVQAVSGTGWPFYNRLIPAGLDRIPGLTENLEQGAKVLELASGAGRGLVKFAETYPNTEIVGVDGDDHTNSLASERLGEAGLGGRASLVLSSLEDFTAESEYDLVFINISMHECRNIDQVAANVKRALKPGGHFVISDFPFPSTHEGLRTPAARVLTGIQYFEAQIDDQLLPTDAFVDLLDRHGFEDVTAFDITPVHNLIHGRK